MVIDQKEHLVPQVYLKQWACENSLTILDCKIGEFKKVQVHEFNRKLNFYDIGWHESDLAKHNENEFGRLEREYLKFLNSVTNQKGLIQEKWQAYCDRLVALMFVRTESYWTVFNDVLKHPNGREKLLNEIYFEMPLDLNVQRIALEMFPYTEPMNIVLCDIARNVQSKLQYFNQVILRTNPKERPFITSTNPVLVFSNSSDTSTFFHWSSEIYLPLSPEYCLYMFHPEYCSSNNKLQDFPNGRISEAAPDFVWDLCTKLNMFSGSSEFVMPHWIAPNELKKLDRDELSKLDSEFGGFF
jgi:hypothetical protein